MSEINKTIDYEALVAHRIVSEELSRNIFQTYKSKDNLPPEIEGNINILKELNPDYQYKLFDDEDIKDFILEHYGDTIWGYYQRISPVYGAARADFFRYLLIYHCGGVYIDIKSSLTKPLDEVLLPNEQFILTHWDNRAGEQYQGMGRYPDVNFLSRGEYIQWCIISVAGHPLLRAVIIQMLRNIDLYNPFRDGAGLWGVLKTTGPVLYTRVIEAMRHQLIDGKDYRLLDSPKDIGLRYSIFDNSGIYGHKQVLKANYNKAYTPIVVSQNPLYTAIAKAYLYSKLVISVLQDKLRRRFS